MYRINSVTNYNVLEFSHGDSLEFSRSVNTTLPASKQNNQAIFFESLLGNQTSKMFCFL